MVQFCSVAQSCLTLCDPKDYSDPKSLGSRTAACQASLFITNSRSLLKLMSIESVMPSNHLTLSSPSPPAFSLSQHQGLFQWVSSSHQVAKTLAFPASASVLPMNIQDWSPLGWTGWISLQSKGLSRVFSNTTVQNEPHSILLHLEIFKIKLEMQLIYKRCALA